MKTLTSTLTALGLAAGIATAAHAGGSYEKDIVDTAGAAGDFETLLTAAEAAGLVETLKGDGPFTVFAPTDDAFAALPEGTVESLLQPENKEQLVEILTYHVVPGEVMSSDIGGETSATTVQGAELTANLTGDAVMIEEATVVTPDVTASNGVIHVIDTVLMPPSIGGS